MRRLRVRFLALNLAAAVLIRVVFRGRLWSTFRLSLGIRLRLSVVKRRFFWSRLWLLVWCRVLCLSRLRVLRVTSLCVMKVFGLFWRSLLFEVRFGSVGFWVDSVGRVLTC